MLLIMLLSFAGEHRGQTTQPQLFFPHRRLTVDLKELYIFFNRWGNVTRFDPLSRSFTRRKKQKRTNTQSPTCKCERMCSSILLFLPSLLFWWTLFKVFASWLSKSVKTITNTASLLMALLFGMLSTLWQLYNGYNITVLPLYFMWMHFEFTQWSHFAVPLQRLPDLEPRPLGGVSLLRLLLGTGRSFETDNLHTAEI